MYNRTAHELPQLAVGTKVAVQDHRTRKWDKYGTIVEVGRNRDYMIRLASGRVWRRNRRFLRRRYAVANPDPPNPVPNPKVQPLAGAPIPHEHPPKTLIRFISRCSNPWKVWSENGINIVGDKAEPARSHQHIDCAKMIFSTRCGGIDWNFNPPQPHAIVVLKTNDKDSQEGASGFVQPQHSPVTRQWPPLLTWFNFNPSMDKLLHPL